MPNVITNGVTTLGPQGISLTEIYRMLMYIHELLCGLNNSQMAAETLGLSILGRTVPEETRIWIYVRKNSSVERGVIQLAQGQGRIKGQKNESPPISWDILPFPWMSERGLQPQTQNYTIDFRLGSKSFWLVMSPTTNCPHYLLVRQAC